MTTSLWLTGDSTADQLLSTDPNALLIGMVLDQQIPMEKAFSGPSVLADRMSGFDLTKIADSDEDEFVALCATPPAVHRFPASMGRRVRDAARYVVAHFDGDITRLYAHVGSGKELWRELKKIPGFGPQKAQIFLALLGKQRGVTPDGWREAAGEYGVDGSKVSVADIVDAESLAEVRAAKKAKKLAAKAAAQ